jgi:hypothetical protein
MEIMERPLARHTLDISGARKSDVGLPGAANNTGDEPCLLHFTLPLQGRERRDTAAFLYLTLSPD